MHDPALDRCTSLVERRLGWGDSAHWATQDFENLSLEIQEQTGRAISATTLKRIWGRVAYHSSPSRHSLDTLALFIGHDSWRDFAQGIDRGAPAPPTDAPAAVASSASTHLSRGMRFAAIPVLLLGLGIAVWMGVDGISDTASPGEVVFRSRPVADGVPNTVVFEYDVGGIEADSFFIQQSWDPRRRAVVAPERKTYTSIYYRPGFFNAQLLADGHVLAAHPIHVTTDGWIAMIDGEPTPIYLPDAFTSSEGALSVAPEWLQAHGHNAAATNQILEYYNVRSFGRVRTDSFSFETALRRTIDDGRYPCGHAEVSVLAERGAIQIPLGIPGCVSEMGLVLGMRYIDGETTDLSAFGSALSGWQVVRLDVRGNDVRIQVGENAPFIAQMNGDAGRIVGLRYRFEGAGAVDYVRLRGADGEAVYDEFF